ncbi:hypothetical protein UFOVP526_33 [uncultured Caudovirales phage]|uniref:Holliday junction resolvase n=1 Tax=uncultured Caudovirales phage TaxID=2100421 RepID=A0A6J5MV05_9CAUD|nr:hypothetical protein UFOVP526_33 [uncultured Caudovirales phage]
MSNPNKAKGDRAELEIAHYLSDKLKRTIRRKLGAGRQDDTGDIEGLHNWTIQVKNRKDIARTIREGMKQLAEQQKNANTDNAVLLVRQTGGTWLAVMTIDQYIALIE